MIIKLGAARTGVSLNGSVEQFEVGGKRGGSREHGAVVTEC